MKKLFCNRIFATCLTVVLMFVSVLLNTSAKLGKKCEDLSASFYSENSVADSLTGFCDAAEDLVSLGLQCEIDSAEAPMEQIREIRGLLSQRSEEYDKIHQEYEALLKETFSLESSLERILSQLNDETAESFSDSRHRAAEAKADIDSCEYNARVTAFRKGNSRFPTPQLARLSGVVFPSLFA